MSLIKFPVASGDLVMGVSVLENDANRWLRYHGQPHPDGIEVEARCSKLKDGRCSVYKNRPMACRVYVLGGPDCLDAVKRRRTPMEYLTIREKEGTDE